ncbi:hypothetical protein QAD02_008906 [Eretmocerus hayati]|uniref:Uncharacterized protein n=1 Tax=Eretmocerus hayati TaxID=131215 RepID=A0ACC2N863_9HYME|nr:hypothetical protein QAD02_008906 [Eretmocerus hayati]
MSGKDRRLFVMIFKTFVESLTPKFTKEVLVGTDYMGTKYYQVSTNRKSIRNKPNRYFVPVEKDNFQQELPAEWEAWLRNRRADPPSEGEVNENYDMILTKRKNAAELEATYAKEGHVQVVNPDAKPLEQHAAMNFPSYDEYKEFGRHYKPKWKKED